jgi:uracil phosphoribosyltransferase
MKKVIVIDHPLMKHKLGYLRDKTNFQNTSL